jgi:hypothetical protein
MRKKPGLRRLAGFTGLIAAVTAMAAIMAGGAGAIVAGAGYTTDNPAVTDECLNGPITGTPGVNCNIYGAKEDVWTNGGPSAGQNKLSTGTYFFVVLEPGGQNDSINDGGPQNLSDDYDSYLDRQFTVGSNGKTATFIGTGHLTDGTSWPSALGLFIQLAPYATTSNPGGVYIMALCKVSDTQATTPVEKTVTPADCKYDAFKVREGEPPPPFGTVSGLKYYDTNTNGQHDPGEPGIANWPINFKNGNSGTIPTDTAGEFSESFLADTYKFWETQAGAPWMQTGNTVNQSESSDGNSSSLNADKSYTVTVVDGGTTIKINFGNICVGAGGGLTLGYWSNKNGGKVITGPPSLLAGVLALNLRKADGSLLGSVSLSVFQKFLTDANATNMANMLSAQMAAMYLNVASGGVNGNALIYAPGTNSANAAGFATVNAVIAEANALLGTGGATKLLILAGHPDRARAEALKTALDNGNNNLNFVQPGPGSCPAPVFP